MVTTKELEILRDIDHCIAQLQTIVSLHRQETRYDRGDILAKISSLEAKVSRLEARVSKPRGPLIDLKALGPLWIPLVTLAGLLAANVPLKEAVLAALK